MDILPLCTACGRQSNDVAEDLHTPCYSCTNHLFFLPILPDPPKYVRCNYPAGIGIRQAAAYPGVQTGDSVSAPEILPFTSSSMLDHTHIDGNTYGITFYKLADGRGWIHDFCPSKPERSSLTRGWVNNLNSAGQPSLTTAVPPLP